MTTNDDPRRKSADPGATAPEHASGLSAEVARMRERFAFNAAFDAQIQQTVASSSDLLRTAAELRSDASQETTTILTRVEEMLVTQDIQHRRLLAAVLAEIAETQFQAERLSAAVENLGGQARSLANRLTYLQMMVKTSMGERAGSPPTGSPHQETTTRPPGRSEHAAAEWPPLTTPPTRTGMGTDRLIPDIGMPFLSPGGAASRFSPGARQPMTVIFQQVPSAAVAHDLQRFVDGLPQVLSVSTREFTAGVLRLQLLIDRGLSADDFRGWNGARLAPLHALTDVIVLRLVNGTASSPANEHVAPRENESTTYAEPTTRPE